MLGWIIFAVFAVMGVLFWTGKGGWLIAGYNTASAEEKKKYDENNGEGMDDYHSKPSVS